MEKYRHYVDGEFVEPSSGAYFESYDPYRGVWINVGAKTANPFVMR